MYFRSIKICVYFSVECVIFYLKSQNAPECVGGLLSASQEAYNVRGSLTSLLTIYHACKKRIPAKFTFNTTKKERTHYVVIFTD